MRAIAVVIAGATVMTAIARPRIWRLLECRIGAFCRSLMSNLARVWTSRLEADERELREFAKRALRVGLPCDPDDC